jgi:hypothetical protein
LKAFYALAFCLLSFAASAQTLESSLAPYYIDLDCLGEAPERSTTPNQSATEPSVESLCEIMLLDTDGIDVSGHSDAGDVPVGGIEPQP